jgi:hypothetical protein
MWGMVRRKWRCSRLHWRGKKSYCAAISGDGVVVITTNPTIFAKAVGSGAGYEPQVKNLAIRDTAVGDERRHQIALGPAPEQSAQFSSGA